MQEVKTVVCLFEKKSKYLPPIYDLLSHKDFRTEFCNPLMYQIEKKTPTKQSIKDYQQV